MDGVAAARSQAALCSMQGMSAVAGRMRGFPGAGASVGSSADPGC